MRTITQHSFGGPEVLELIDVATPQPGPGQVRVTATALGVNPVDVAVRAGYYPLLGEPPFTLGWDVAGIVSAVGADVEGFAEGDRVFGMPSFPAAANAYAEEVIADAVDLAHTPDRIGDEAAAALPLVGLTAHQALVEVGQVSPGDRVLVQAGGGGVGHVAVQIAKARGAHVIATASPGKVDFVRGLGADEIIDYTSTDFTQIEPVDLAIDPFGGDNTLRTLGVVRDGGTLALLVMDFDDATRAAAAARQIRLARVSVRPDAAALADLTRLVADGQLTPHVSATFALEKAGQAHELLATGVQGKVVLLP